MLRDNLVGLIEPMRISAGADPRALSIQKHASDDRPSCLENPRPDGAESSLTENVTSPFQAEPVQLESTPGSQAVLVSADSMQAVRAAYPNFYADTSAFVKALHEAIADKSQRDVPDILKT